MNSHSALAIQTEVGNRVRKAMMKVYRQNTAVGFDADRVAKIDALVASGRFTDQDRNALNAMTPETLDKLSAKKAKEVTADMTSDDADRLSKEDAPNYRDDPRGNRADADYSGRATPGFVVSATPKSRSLISTSCASKARSLPMYAMPATRSCVTTTHNARA